MLDIALLFALQQCEHYAYVLAEEQSAVNIEIHQMACEAATQQHYGSAFKFKECAYREGGPMVCEFEVAE